MVLVMVVMVQCLLCRLKPLDVEVMKQLHNKVNIIPLIAKADTMTADECRDFKKTVSVFKENSSCTVFVFAVVDILRALNNALESISIIDKL